MRDNRETAHSFEHLYKNPSLFRGLQDDVMKFIIGIGVEIFFLWMWIVVARLDQKVTHDHRYRDNIMLSMLKLLNVRELRRIVEARTLTMTKLSAYDKIIYNKTQEHRLTDLTSNLKD